jgi:hypothetical protein
MTSAMRIDFIYVSSGGGGEGPKMKKASIHLGKKDKHKKGPDRFESFSYFSSPDIQQKKYYIQRLPIRTAVWHAQEIQR